MLSKLFVAASGKRNKTNPLSFLTDEIVDSPRRAGVTRALTLTLGEFCHRSSVISK
jgi:hypothetical protein